MTIFPVSGSVSSTSKSGDQDHRHLGLRDHRRGPPASRREHEPDVDREFLHELERAPDVAGLAARDERRNLALEQPDQRGLPALDRERLEVELRFPVGLASRCRAPSARGSRCASSSAARSFARCAARFPWAGIIEILRPGVCDDRHVLDDAADRPDDAPHAADDGAVAGHDVERVDAVARAVVEERPRRIDRVEHRDERHDVHELVRPVDAFGRVRHHVRGHHDLVLRVDRWGRGTAVVQLCPDLGDLSVLDADVLAVELRPGARDDVGVPDHEVLAPPRRGGGGRARRGSRKTGGSHGISVLLDSGAAPCAR